MASKSETDALLEAPHPWDPRHKKLRPLERLLFWPVFCTVLVPLAWTTSGVASTRRASKASTQPRIAPQDQQSS